MSNNREKDLWKELRKREVWLSLLLIGALIFLYPVFGLMKPNEEGSLLGAYRRLVADVIANVIPVLLVFILSYSLLHRIQALRAEKETEELVNKIALKFAKVPALKTRSKVIKVDDLAKGASEICILVVTGASVITPNMGFYETKIRDGCNIRTVLLDPNGPSLQTWELLKGTSVIKRIESSLADLKRLQQLPEAKGKCDFRVSEVFLPFSICAVDLEKESGAMNVEYHSYKLPIDKRPHVHLTASDSPYWFNYYRQQFEQAWHDANEPS